MAWPEKVAKKGAVRMTNSSGQQVSLWGVNNQPGVKAAI